MLGAAAAGAGIYTLFGESDKSQAAGGSGMPGGAPGSAPGAAAPPEQPRGAEEIRPSLEKPGDQKAKEPEVESPQGKEPGQSDKEKYPHLQKKKNKLELTYPADDIISRNSKYSFHRRPLLNSEALLENENYSGALEILNRTNSRVDDEDINFKIGKNISDIENFLKSDDTGEYESGQPGKEEGALDEDIIDVIKSVSENLAEALSRSFKAPFIIAAGPEQAVQIPREELEKYLPDFKNLENLVNPVVFQITQPPPRETPEKKDYREPPEKKEEPGKEAEPEPEEPESEEYADDTFFTEEWEKFKDLPLSDRRSGTDRRQSPDRREDDERKSDRRSGEDRRKRDLFQEREDYLKEKAEEKKKEKEEKARQEEAEARRRAEEQKYLPDAGEEEEKKGEAPKLPGEWPFDVPLPIKYGLPEIEIINLALPEPKDINLQPEVEGGAPSGGAGGPGGAPGAPGVPSGPGEEGGKPEEGGMPQLPEGRDVQEEEPGEIGDKEEKPSVPSLNLPDPVDFESGKEPETRIPEIPSLGGDEDHEAPEIEMVDGDLSTLGEEEGEGEEAAEPEEPEKVIHGVLELKPPEEDDAPFLTLTYDFSKIPDSFKLSKNYSIMEYGYYKYKPMLVKAQEFARRKMLKNALNYYRVVKSQNIPPELKGMINRNIKDITEFLEKYLMAKGG